MDFDILITCRTGEPAKMKRTLSSLAAVDYPLHELNIHVARSASPPPPPTPPVDISSFGGFTIHHLPGKTDGRCLNAAIESSTSSHVVILCAGAAVLPDFFAHLSGYCARWPQAGAFACRNIPCEADFLYSPVTLGTYYVGGCGVVVRRQALEEAGGFDARFLSDYRYYDLSRRLAANGFRMYYLPGCTLFTEDIDAPTQNQQYIIEAKEALYYSYKHGNAAQWAATQKEFFSRLRHPPHFDGVRKKLAVAWVSHLGGLWPFWLWRLAHPRLAARAPFPHPDTMLVHRGAEALAQPLAGGPLVSVVVRTCGRPRRLRGALRSILNQNYPNYEIIVVEDGPPTAKPMIEGEFSFAPIRYHATKTHVGRGAAGNLGLQMAQGEYICFLDEDDLFFPEHLELFVAKALQHPDADMILGSALAAKIDVHSEEPFRYTIRDISLIHFDRLDIFTMSQMCQIPIQTVLFKKSLYTQRGGLASHLSAHEDWYMWMRFLTVAKRIHPTQVDIHRATSIFTQPADEEKARQRMAEYAKNDAEFFSDPTLRFEVTMKDMRDFYDGMLADVAHLQRLGQTDVFLKQQAERRSLSNTDQPT